jgi:hypothetical protein
VAGHDAAQRPIDTSVSHPARRYNYWLGGKETGLPTADNTHEVAQAIAPESRIVYVDNDPMVMCTRGPC